MLPLVDSDCSGKTPDKGNVKSQVFPNSLVSLIAQTYLRLKQTFEFWWPFLFEEKQTKYSDVHCVKMIDVDVRIDSFTGLRISSSYCSVPYKSAGLVTSFPVRSSSTKEAFVWDAHEVVNIKWKYRPWCLYECPQTYFSCLLRSEVTPGDHLLWSRWGIGQSWSPGFEFILQMKKYYCSLHWYSHASGRWHSELVLKLWKMYHWWHLVLFF